MNLDPCPAAPVPPELFREVEVFDWVCRHMATLTARRGNDFEDLVQSAAERAFRGLEGFEGRCSLSTWVFRICYTTLLHERRWYRRFSRRIKLSPSGELPEAPAPEAASPAELREARVRLHGALERLNEKLRIVVLLHDLEGREAEEIAEMLELNVLTVRSRLRDGRRALRARLARDPYFGDRACGKSEVRS